MKTKHTVAFGESLLAIAKYYGFGSVDPIAGHPDNQQLLGERDIQPGDTLTIPAGKQGESSHGTGRGHEIVVQTIANRFLLRLWTAFHKEDPEFPGDYAQRSSQRWLAFGKRPIYQIEAKVEFRLLGGSPKGPMPSDGTSSARTGRYETAALGDGSWLVTITPGSHELSTGPAYADATGDHGLGHYTSKKEGTKSGKPNKPLPSNRIFELEFRPLELQVDVHAGAIVSATVHTDPAPTRPHHAVLYWINCESKGVPTDTQVLDVDWKPDFLRRICEKLRPKQKARKSNIDIIQLHHTAGDDIGPALHGFFAEKGSSGAHFLVDIDGHVVRIADDRYHTQHGGGASTTRKPSWGTGTSINDRAIGIEHVHDAPALTAEIADREKLKYTDAQYQASIGLIRSLIDAYGVKLNNVIGHQDAVVKAMCPGWVLDWPRLEQAGVALGPATLDSTELETMFGGFFAGTDGRTRKLPLAAREKLITADGKTTVTVVNSKGGKLAEGLTGHPIRELRQALLNIGYAPDASIKDGDETYKKAPDGEFGKAFGFALSQFIRHYCTGSRLRIDLSQAYRDSPRIWSGLFVDFELAKLIKAVEKAALLLP